MMESPQRKISLIFKDPKIILTYAEQASATTLMCRKINAVNDSFCYTPCQRTQFLVGT